MYDSSSNVRTRTIAPVALMLLGLIRPAAAEEPPPASQAVTEKIAVLRLEALGMDAEPVSRLESLFRMEIERLAGRPLPTRRQIDAVIKGSRKLKRCGGDNKCLAQIGAALGVDLPELAVALRRLVVGVGDQRRSEGVREGRATRAGRTGDEPGVSERRGVGGGGAERLDGIGLPPDGVPGEGRGGGS